MIDLKNCFAVIFSVLVVSFGPLLQTRSLERSFFSFLGSAEMTNPFTIKATNKPKMLVVFLHGLGDNGAGWMQAFEEIKNPNVCYVFPNAPGIPVSLNFGMVMPAWFDIKALDFDGDEDKKGIQKTANQTRALIKEQMEKYELTSDKVILGGFSQGGAIALYTALTHEEKLAGVLALSSWLPLHQLFVDSKEGHSLTKQGCEIQQYHGEADMMVKLKYGKMTNDLLKKAGVKASLKTYKHVEHSSCPQEMRDIQVYIEGLVSSK